MTSKGAGQSFKTEQSTPARHPVFGGIHLLHHISAPTSIQPGEPLHPKGALMPHIAFTIHLLGTPVLYQVCYEQVIFALYSKSP